MGRLIVVSQRVSRPGEPPVAGGLAIALVPVVARHDAIWLGPQDFDDAMPPTVRRGHAAWSNTVLWPALHGLDTNIPPDDTGRVAYRAYNRLLARALTPWLADGDRVWIHDFQLLTLGAELRRIGVRATLGFFLHVPLPRLAQLAHVPGSRALVRALVACDSVGFQTTADLAAFQEATPSNRLLSFASPVSVDLGAVRRAAGVGDFPFRHSPYALGVDRLDASKGLPQRLEAAGAWLAGAPDWRFVQVAAPSRMELAPQQALAAGLRRVASTTNRLNLVEACLPHADVLAGMARARVGCVTPLCDGMNLVAKEYVAAQDAADPGVLVLSHTAGAAREFDAALLVNARDPAAIAPALQAAAGMPLTERRNRHASLYAALVRHTLDDWASECLAPLSTHMSTTAAAPTVTSPISA